MSRRILSSHVDEDIMDEVMKMTMKVGTGLVSTKEIAKHLGFSEPVIFAHFRTKQELMDKTFEYCWKPFAGDTFFDVGPGLPDNREFDFYKPYILKSLSYKKQLVYAQHYLASSYCNEKVVEKTWAPTRKFFVSVFKKFEPSIPDDECNFIARVCIGFRVNTACLFILKEFEPTDRNIKNAFTIIDEGLVQCIGAYAPEKLAQIRLTQANRFINKK
jgi:AcrR family transcriptional regulator